MTKSRYLDIVIYMKAVNYFKALADETRLRLVHLSLHYELNVNEIVAILGMGQSRISRHLKILTDSHLLTFRRDGLWTFYSAVTEGEGYNFIQSIKYLFGTTPIFTEDLAEADRVLEKRSLEETRFFDSIAEDWEKLKREIIGDVNLNALILQAVPVSDTIVDIGCGTGDLLVPLKEKSKLVIGVDKSPKMLHEAKRRFAEDGEDVDLRIGEVEHLPLREGEADLAVINMVLHHAVHPLKAFSEANRVLKKGDAFIIVDLLRHHLERMRERYGDRWLGFSITDIKKWLKSNGFNIGKIDYFNLKKGLKGFMVQSVKE
ncbi:MAG: ArsR family transcriptional regulator [Candidatus Aminicenantes bacterium]|nr:MAG: ArsR family transcriptional regulator [Candidatus Aminicenantes bacterium]